MPAQGAGPWRRLRQAAACWLFAAVGAAQAGLPQLCDHAADLSAAQKDTLLRVAAIVKSQLDRSGAHAALVARSGIDLSRFGLRYSHAGISLKDNANAPWSVRQLYYDCDQGQPRLFDQGMAGFLMGTDDPGQAYLSLVLLPPDIQGAVAQTALDNTLALRFLGQTYSANAYAFSTRYQNCNQWLIELLAAALGGLSQPSDALAEQPRQQAQQWLIEAGYEPVAVDVSAPFLDVAEALMPWVHSDDHPAADRSRRLRRVSLPQSIEAFVHQQAPEARRIEICHNGVQVVLRRGWAPPIAAGCVPAAGDEVIALR